MVLPEREKKIIKDLIGRKLEKVLYPESAFDPVEAYLMLGDGDIVKIDSCFREEMPTETAKKYPQFRVQIIDSLPEFMRWKELEISDEIISSTGVLDEEYQTPDCYISFTKAIRIDCSNRKKLTLLRQSYAMPALTLMMSDISMESLEHSGYEKYDQTKF